MLCSGTALCIVCSWTVPESTGSRMKYCTNEGWAMGGIEVGEGVIYAKNTGHVQQKCDFK